MASINASEIQEKWKSLLSQTTLVLEDVDPNWGSIRLDVQSLRPLLSELNEQDSGVAAKDPVLAAVELFWNQYQPLRRTIDYPKLNLPEAVAEPLSFELEQLILDLLHHLQVQNEIPYEPDGDDSQWIEELQAYLHIVGARAFRHMRYENGYSEPARECLEDAERAIERIRSAKRATGDYDLGLRDNTLSDLSTNAVAALVLVERSRLERADGDYGTALHSFASADLLFHLANGSVQMPSQMEERLQQPVMPRSEVSNLFEAIQSNRLIVQNWQQVTRDCTEILEGWEIGDDADVAEWIAFWREARSWASAQLSPNEYQKMRKRDEMEAAERRLKNYFFEDDWALLPTRAQGALKLADQIWNSRELGRRESIVNELRVASEEFCYRFIWQPMSESKESSLHFLKFEANATDRHSTPSSRDFVRLCRQPFFRDHLRRHNLAANDIQFLREELPNLIKQLLDYRNPAEHEIEGTTTEDVIADCFRTFLGIGKDGVLPRLARIGRKLRGGRRRNN